jgi:hypothetical protein
LRYFGFVGWGAMKASKARFGWNRLFLIARLVIAALSLALDCH